MNKSKDYRARMKTSWPSIKKTYYILEKWRYRLFEKESCISCARLIALSKFGFLSLQAAGGKRRVRMRYAFLHKSFQEFFSGFNLACKLIEGDIDCESVVTDQRYEDKLKQVFLFTIGILCSTSEKTAASFVESIAVNIESDSRLLFALDCLSEYESLVHTLGEHLNLTHLKIPMKYDLLAHSEWCEGFRPILA